MSRFATLSRRVLLVAGVVAIVGALPASTAAASARIGWLLQAGANDGSRTNVAVFSFSDDACPADAGPCEAKITVTLAGMHTLPSGDKASALIVLDSPTGVTYARVQLAGFEPVSFATSTDGGVTRTTSTALVRDVTTATCEINVAGAATGCALPADHFGVKLVDPVVRTPETATLTARDVYGQKVTGYRGTVRISDPARALLPSSATFTAADAGVHAVSGIVFRKAGKQVLRFRDTTTRWPNTAVRIVVGS